MSAIEDAVIEWEGETPPADVVAKVRADIASELVDLGHPSDLIFHTVFLGDDMMKGPCVTLRGRNKSDIFTGVYRP